MADTTTTNQGFTKVEVGASEDTWGGKLNQNWDDLDTLLGAVTAAEIAKLDGLTATTAELNILDGQDQGVATTDDVTFNSVAATTSITSATITTTGDITAGGDVAANTGQFLGASPASDSSGPAKPAFTFGGQATSTGMYLVTNATLGFSTGGSERMRIGSGGKVGIGKAALVKLDIDGTDAVQIPVGTTAQRPTNTAGRIRWNSTEGEYEGGTGSGWVSLSSAAGASAFWVDEKSAGTDGGGSSVGVQSRDLNTERWNTISGASLNGGTGEFTLPAGTFLIEASAACLGGSSHRIRLYNVTDAAIEELGTSEFSFATGPDTTRSFVRARVTLASSKAFRIDHDINSARASDGLGSAVSDGANNEVYTTVLVTQEA